MKKNRTNESGQVLIEFLFCIAFSLGILVMFIHLSLNATVGYVIHYATYMASRAYLVSDNYSYSDPYSDAEIKSQKIFDFILKQSLFSTTGSSNYLMRTEGEPTLQFNKIQSGRGNRVTKVFVGPYFRFSQKLAVPTVGRQRELKMISESFLGKEPTRSSCLSRIIQIMQNEANYTPDPINPHATLFDDGC